MIKRKKHSCKYEVHKAIIYKLSQKQIFWLCIMSLLVLAIIGIFSPSALIGLM